MNWIKNFGYSDYYFILKFGFQGRDVVFDREVGLICKEILEYGYIDTIKIGDTSLYLEIEFMSKNITVVRKCFGRSQFKIILDS